MSIINFFDKLEDKIRAKLSHYPIFYTIVGGFAIVIFWRGVWITADMLAENGGVWSLIFSGPGSILLSISVLLSIGLFVSFFVGDSILMTGLKKEKKLIEKTETEIRDELEVLEDVESRLDDIEEELDEMKNK
ncbi:MAG: hypothetical protein NUV47_02605 [Patescibacteria group bacterium]|nr:hypothetical protein [Patescibacteria group bacterium]